jgi:putative PIN family toxin of toxin-antitoxin system
VFYAVIDTNVLVSALLNVQSNPGVVLQSVFEGATIPLMNTEIITEYWTVLTREKFSFPVKLVDVVLRRFVECGLLVSVSLEGHQDVVDPKDRCFYAVTLSGREAGDALLITGNVRHFPRKPFVLSPAQFVEKLRENGDGTCWKGKSSV